MSTARFPHNPSTVSLDGHRVTISEFTIESAELAEILNGHDDHEATLRSVILAGAAVASFGSTQASVSLMNKQLSSAMGTFRQETNRLFNENDGEFVAAADAVTNKITNLFDPELQGSVTDKIRDAQAELIALMSRRLLNQLSLDNTSGPLTALQRNIVDSIHTPVDKKLDDVLAQMAELKTEKAVDEEKAESFEKSTAKGVAFEQEVEHMLAPVAEGLGDDLFLTGDTTGTSGKKGDLVSEVDPNIANDMRIVVECKKRNVSKPAIRKELEEAVTNREAVAAMAVFASQDLAPTNQTIVLHGRDRMIVALPEENPEVVLGAAYTCLRALALREMAAATDDVDTGAITDAVAELNGIFSDLRNINKAHNAIQRGLEDGRKAVETLVNKAKDATGKVSAALDVDAS